MLIDKDPLFDLKRAARNLKKNKAAAPKTFDEKILSITNIGEFARDYKISLIRNEQFACQPYINIKIKGLTDDQYKKIQDRFLAIYEATKMDMIKNLGVPCENVSGILHNTIMNAMKKNR